MNEQLQKALGELLDKSLNAVDFMVAELPDVVQQLLLWKMWEGLIWFILGVFIVLFVIIFNKKTWARNWESTVREDAPIILINVFPSILCIIFALAECFNIAWLKILVAPKVYLIEYAASLAK